MEINLNQYVPCLRWKQGEYQALSKLSSNTKNNLKPLIEIPEIGYDFEKRIESKIIDDHLAKVAQRIEANWGCGDCFVDFSLIDPSERMITGQHPLDFVFAQLRAKGIMAVPVINLRQDADCQNTILDIIRADKRGGCARINIEESAKTDLKQSLDVFLCKYHLESNECDFILDLGSPNFVPLDGFVNLLKSIINKLPYLDNWRSFVVIGTSFPRSMAEVSPGLSIRKRNEWLIYKSLIGSLRDAGIRIPSFGDYGINHPDILRLDMRHVKPYASVRYTIDDAYLIAKGLNVRDHKFHQFRGLCQEVINSNHYYGEGFSDGDKYIHDCAHGTASTGHLTTWRWVGTNHHLEKVARDISNLSV